MSTTLDDNTPDYAGMTLTGVLAKHRQLRGSDTLKYPPTREKRCKLRCGLDDMAEGEGTKRHTTDHICFYAVGHSGPCQWSSECGLMVRGEAQ